MRRVFEELSLLVRVSRRGLDAVHVPGTRRGFDVAEVEVDGFVAIFRGDFRSRSVFGKRDVEKRENDSIE